MKSTELLFELYEKFDPCDKAVLCNAVADEHKDGSDEQARAREMAEYWQVVAEGSSADK